MTYYKYHGSSRSLNTASPLPYDIVLSTYGTIATDFGNGGGALNRFRWHRLVLDEGRLCVTERHRPIWIIAKIVRAHVIRNSSTKAFKAAMSLSAEIHWCMSGTPVQNSLDDLEALIQFLRIPVLSDSSVFRKFVAGTSTAGSIRRPNYENLRILLASICLRRSFSILPELGVSFQVHKPTLSESERRDYAAWEAVCKERINVAVSSRRAKGGARVVLTAILLLRIFCNTGVNSALTVGNFFANSQPDEVSSLLQQSGGEAVCVECNNDIPSQAASYTANKKRLLDRLLCHECMSRASIPAG